MSGRRAPLIAGLAVGAISILAIVFLVMPKIGQVGETQTQLEEAQDREIQLEVQLRALQEAQAAAPETERQIQLLEDQVPPTADLPALIRLLQSAADRAAVDFFSFTPGTPATDPSGQFSRILSSVTVTGGYFSIDEFLFLLETLPRAAKGTAITISPAAGGATTPATSVKLTLVATVEFYTTDTSAGPGSVPGPSDEPTGA